MKKSIHNFIKDNPQIVYEKRGFPNIGTRRDGKKFGTALKKIEKAWKFYDYDLYNIKSNNQIVNLGNGNPIRFKPFPEAINYLKINKNRGTAPPSLHMMFYR